MDRVTFSIQNKKFSHIILFTVLGSAIGIFIALKFVKVLEFLASSGYSIFVLVCIILVFLIALRILTGYLPKFITTIFFQVTVEDQILIIEEKTSNGAIKSYSVDLRDIYTLYYNKHVRYSEVLSLKIKLVDIHNKTKFQIRSSYFESADGKGKENMENLVSLFDVICERLNLDVSKTKGKYIFMDNLRKYKVK